VTVQFPPEAPENPPQLFQRSACVMRSKNGEYGFDFLSGAKVFPHRPAVGPIHTRVQWAQRVFFLKKKKQCWGEDNCSLPSSAEIVNAEACISTPSCPAHRENLPFPLLGN
jgi:hypothetical protein